MYDNLLVAMENETVSIMQISRLLKKRELFIHDLIYGGIKSGFSAQDACKIKDSFFAEYDIFFLFKRT